MIYLALIVLVAAMLYFQKLIRDGKIPRADSPNGLPTRIVAICLFAVSVLLFTLFTLHGSINVSNIFTAILIGGGAAAAALLVAKRRKDLWKAGKLKKRSMKSSLIFLGFAILIAIFLILITLPAHK